MKRRDALQGRDRRARVAGAVSGALLFLVAGVALGLLLRLAGTGAEEAPSGVVGPGSVNVGSATGSGRSAAVPPEKILYRVGNTKCPIMGGAVEANRVVVEGIEIGICCRPCENDIREDPTGTLRTLLRDPVSGPGLAAWLEEHPEVARRVGLAAPEAPAPAVARPPAPGRCETALANATCLVDGIEITDPVPVDVGGLVVRLCRPECARAFEKEPQAWLDRFAREDPRLRQRIEAHRDLLARGGHGPHWRCSTCPLRSAAPGPCPSCGEMLIRPTDEPVYMLDNTRCPVMGDPVRDGALVVHRGIGVRICCPSCIATFEQNPRYYLAKLEREEGIRVPRLVEKE